MQDIQIPPTHSPVLAPTPTRRALSRGLSTAQPQQKSSLGTNEADVLDGLHSEDYENGYGDEDDSDSDDDDEDVEDFSLEDGHLEGVPSSGRRLLAKHYHQPSFASELLTLLTTELAIPGWSSLPSDVPRGLLKIHKVSGSTTNAVFFVSIPETEVSVEVPEKAGEAEPLPEDDTSGRATPKPSDKGLSRFLPHIPHHPFGHRKHSVTISAPTVLLRVYGPSSGNLISRKTELYILHTLSDKYGIGPAVLGTFGNGRVEEYFRSRALLKEEMREPTVSRWIGRRMRELHSVDLGAMELPGAENERQSRQERPKLEGGRSGTSQHSILSTSSGSSIFSFGEGSTYSFSSSDGGSSYSLSLPPVGDIPLTESPLLLPQRGISSSRAPAKKRARSGSVSLSSARKRMQGRLGVWENITRWTREAKVVLAELDKLVATPGFAGSLTPPAKSPFLSPSDGAAHSQTHKHVQPVTSARLTMELRAALNLPLFEQQVKLYRSFVKAQEKKEGKSKPVFCHNDAQYGNLLLLSPEEGEDEKRFERAIQPPHRRIIVVDFEYASANPRAFDIANHFIEWQVNYHSEDMSHSLSAHLPYPTPEERRRFLRAYLGTDMYEDASTSSSASTSSRSSRETTPVVEEDPRIAKLEQEVKLWAPGSHAMYAVWGVVQAKDELFAQIAKWKKGIETEDGSVDVDEVIEKLDLSADGGLDSAKSDNSQAQEKKAEEEADFDYLSYALERMNLFRKELAELGVIEA